MNLSIIPIVTVMDDPLGDLVWLEWLLNFRGIDTVFHDLSMFVFKGEFLEVQCLDTSIEVPQWVANLNPDQAYALGVDAFEPGVPNV